MQGESVSALFKKNALGMVIAAMAAMLGVVVDGTIISHFYGPESMAAYGLATPVVNLVTVFSGVFSTGTQIVCAQHIGAGNKENANRTFSMCMTATVLLSAAMMAIIYFLKDPICVMLGASGESSHLLPLSSDYLYGLLFSIPSVLLLFEFNGLMRLDNDPNRIIVAVAAMTILDIAFDLMNVFFFGLGMFGMGLATSVSYTIALVIMLLHFTKKDRLFHPTLRGLKLKDLTDIVTAGSSSAVGSASAMLRNRALNGIMLGTVAAVSATAALSVLNTVLNLTSCTMVGVGMTVSMIAGMISGSGNKEDAEELVKTAGKYAVIIGVIMFCILFALAPALAKLFGASHSEEMTAMVRRALRIYSVGCILYAVNTSFITYAQGLRKISISNIFCFLENCVFIVLPALALSGRFDADAVWFAYVITEVLTLLSVFVFMAVRKRGLPFRARDYILMK